MIRKMTVRDWREKKIKSALKDDETNSFFIYFEDGSTAQVPVGAEIDAKDDDKLCNLCGLTCKFYDDDYGFHAEASGGYHSTAGNGEGALDDGNIYKFSLCEFCLDWMFSQFKIPVDIGSYFGRTDKEPFVPAFDRVHRDEWRSLKSKFLEEFNRRNAARRK